MSAAADWTALGTATLSDALDRLGLDGCTLPLFPLNPAWTLAGPAFTVSMTSSTRHGRGVGDYVDDVPAGAVVVIDNGGRLDVTVWGDLLTATAARRRLAGTVIDGACRDTATTAAGAYSIFSAGRFMRTGKDRVEMAATQVPIQLGATRIAPDDVVVGDADGIVVIPQRHALALYSVAREIDGAEEAMRTRVEQGARLRDARATAGYHALQRRGAP